MRTARGVGGEQREEAIMSFKQIQVHVENKIGLIKMNRPDIRNAMTMESRKELLAAFQQLQNESSVHVVILTGAGTAFCAGGDLRTLKDTNSIEGRKRVKIGHDLIRTVLRMEKPVIAAVNGAAAGAGFSLALACDMIFATRPAFFVQSFIQVGLIPDLGSIHFLTGLLGHHRAKELMMLGERVTADQARQMGIVNHLTENDDLLEKAYATAEKLANLPGVALGLTKAIANQNLTDYLEETLEMEALAQALCFQTEDFHEGVEAFFSKRSPKFTGK